VAQGAGAAGPSESSRETVPTHWVSMIKHTLANLGPAVSAERMLHDYVNNLYCPAAVSGRRAVAESFKEAKELAAWTTKVRNAWPAGCGGARGLRGRLRGTPGGRQRSKSMPMWPSTASHPDDVSVEVAFGRAEESDELEDIVVAELDSVEDLGNGRHLFNGSVGHQPLRFLRLHRPRVPEAQRVGFQS
jgi:starch phosphorylase